MTRLTPEQLRQALERAAERVDTPVDSELDRARLARQRSRRAPIFVLIAAAVAIGGVLVVVGGRRPSSTTTVVQRPASTTTAPTSSPSTTSKAQFDAEVLRVLAAMRRQLPVDRPVVHMYDRRTHQQVEVPREEFLALARRLARDGGYVDEHGYPTHVLALDDGKLGLGLAWRCTERPDGQVACGGGG